MADQRKTINLLPAANQTATLSKFFNATVDHLFQPENTEFLAGYIGNHPAWYNADTDFYIQEPTSDRENYQLTPAAVSQDPLSGTVSNVLFYDDLLNKLRLQGANVSKPERLFNGEYYSWSPPVDLDMLINWTNYYWVPAGPNRIDLLDATDFAANCQGQPQYTYTGRYVIADALGNTSVDNIVTGTVKFTSGLKIRFAQDVRTHYNGVDWVVCNVGRSIILQDDNWASLPNGPLRQAVATGPDWWTMERGSANNNSWSTTNRWFHIDVLQTSQTVVSTNVTEGTIQTYCIQSHRPILQYLRNLELVDQGQTFRGFVTHIYNDTTLLNNFVGLAAPTMNGRPLVDGDLILAVGDLDPNVNGRIYKVSGLSSALQQCVLTSQTRSAMDFNTAAQQNDQILNVSSSGIIDTWRYTGGMWVKSAMSRGQGQPLFELYDIDGNRVSDLNIYPGSTFTGSQLFSYNLSDNSIQDPVLQISAQQNAFGDWIFNNYQSTDTWMYISDGQDATITGYAFAQVLGDDFQSQEYINGWYASATPSRQYYNFQYQVVNQSLINTGEINERAGDLSQEATTGDLYTLETYVSPQHTAANTLPNLYVSLARGGQNTTLLDGQDYTVATTGEIKLTEPAQTSDRYFVKIWLGNQSPTDLDGYYDLPWNLTNNPNNQDITLVSRGEYLQHMLSIIANQTGVTGNPDGVNNYRDTARNPSLGLYIMQHTASMLKLALLNSTPQNDVNSVTGATDPQIVMTWAEQQYVSWYGRFVNSLFNLYNKQGYNGMQDPQTWITSALATVNLGKNSRSAWANSGYDPSLYAGSYCEIPAQSPTWIPATGARLGITSVFHPQVFLDYTQSNTPLVLTTHDGAQIIMTDSEGAILGTITTNALSTSDPSLLSHPVAAAWLQFELNQYNGLPSRYRDPDRQVRFNICSVVPGKWRTDQYSQDEYVQLQRGSFDKWLIGTQANATNNTGFDLNDQFSFNYRSLNDLDNQPLPGNWRGIYQWFYDTDRPDLRPWEMLGFSQQPTWWTAEYGVAPYTSGNTKLWTDLSQGLIRQGDLAGLHRPWSRPGLLRCIPVDSQGYLVPPLAAGIVSSLPSTTNARSDWSFGDGAPVEQVWRKSISTSFTQAWCGYLLKPAQFVELNWDILRTQQVYSGTPYAQWIYTDVATRKSSAEFIMHRENPSTLSLPASLNSLSTSTYYGSCGLQHWFSEYLVNSSKSVTLYLGNIMRGGNVNLGHKFAGYVKSDSMRVLVDSFGKLDYQSRIIPQENQHVYLYRSGSIGEYFYSGVVVQKLRNGYKVFGYDAISPQFTTIPVNTAGVRHIETLGNLKVTFYQQGKSTSQTIAYGTVFSTPQQVVDFLMGWGMWLEKQGWSFESINGDNNQIINWQYSAREFIFWCQGSWGVDNFIALSPASQGITFQTPTGQIQYLNGQQSGVYPIINKTGTPILARNLETLREDKQITINPTNSDTVYGARLFVTTLEHIMLLDNITQFGDVVYQPLYAQLQPRVKIFTYRTLDWDGRFYAPGFFLHRQTDNTYVMTDNFEKTSNDMRKYFNIDQPNQYHVVNNSTSLTLQQSIMNGADQTSASGITQQVNQQSVTTNKIISDLAKHNYGYQKRDYLQNLLWEDATEFEFYQGYIRQKGSLNSINALLRNAGLVPANANFEYFEEFALRLGRYGGIDVNNQIEFELNNSDVISNPQWINLFSRSEYDNPDDDVINLVPGDARIVTAPDNYQTSGFTLREGYLNDPLTDVPTAGYVQLAETTWQTNNASDLLTLWDNANGSATPVKIADTVWQFYTDVGSWSSYVLLDVGVTIMQTQPSTSTTSPTTIVCNGFIDLVNGDVVVIQNVTGVASLTGTFVVSNVDVANNTFTVPVSTFEKGAGGTIWKYYNTRFSTTSQRDSKTPMTGWPQGIHVYVDQGDQISGAWTVYSRLVKTWIPIRNQPLQVDGSLLQNATLYDSTYQTSSVVLQYFDPVQGFIPSIAEVDLVYKRETDPAKYNYGDTSNQDLIAEQSWGDRHVGETWWDLSAVRYVDYHQGDLRYRVANWGKLAPGTTVDIYEWVKSPVSPTVWAKYVSNGQDLSQFGVSYTPLGTVFNENNPSWTQVSALKADGTTQTWYYFWVKNSAMTPAVRWRTLTTLQMSTVITNPPSQGVTWWAAIDNQNILVANVKHYLKGTQKILQINWQDHASDATPHSQWQLVRPGDVRSVIDNQFWTRLTASLVGWDGLDQDVPDYRLHATAQLGNQARPRQSWFSNAVKAGETFVYVTNKLIASLVDPLVADPNKTTWLDYFSQSEPPPPAGGNWQYHVANISQRDALLPTVPVHSQVLVDATMQTNNKWVIYQYNGNNVWTLVSQQAWNANLYWKYIDWYAKGYDSATYITQTVPDNNSLALLSPSTGQVIKVLNNGQGQWQLFSWTGSQWQLAAQQNASIEILPALYNNSVNMLNWDQAPFDTKVFDENASIPFYNIIQGLRNIIFDTLDLNNLMMSMINYVLSEQTFVDWVTKTSYITLRGFNLPLSHSQLYEVDNTESLLKYINEVKPYRSKIREFINARTQLDLVGMRTTDFDKPPYVYNSGEVVILDPSHDQDAAFMSKDKRYQDWYANYLTSIHSHLVREIKTTIYIDRISSDAYGWDYVWQDATGYSTTSSAEVWGAATRIRDDYRPSPDMPPVSDIAVLLQSEYKGQIIDTLPLNYTVGWNGTSWNNQAGWDPDVNSLYDYLDMIIQGGEVPEYDVFTPAAGGSNSFTLSYIPQAVAQTVIWVNSEISVYGVDWIIPNWITNATVVDPGQGYQVGDLLEIYGGTNLIPARIQVTTVSAGGGITGITVVDPGSWDVVPGGSLPMQPKPYPVPSLGIGATIWPTWGGRALKLNATTANKVYVLYHGQTFHAAPSGDWDSVYDGYRFLQPDVNDNRPPELVALKIPQSIVWTITSTVVKKVLIKDNQQWTQTLPATGTALLQDVYATSDAIDVSDVTSLILPNAGTPGLVWVGDELIAWWKMQPAPTIAHPNRAILRNLWRNYQATAGNPRQTYYTQFADGNGTTTSWTPSWGSNLRSVWVNNRIQTMGTGKDYAMVGSAVVFNHPPLAGSKLRFSWLQNTALLTQISHSVGDAVYDAHSTQEII